MLSIESILGLALMFAVLYMTYQKVEEDQLKFQAKKASDRDKARRVAQYELHQRPSGRKFVRNASPSNESSTAQQTDGDYLFDEVPEWDTTLSYVPSKQHLIRRPPLDEQH